MKFSTNSPQVDIEVSIIWNDITWKFPVEAFMSTPASEVINTIEQGFTKMQSKAAATTGHGKIRFTCNKWGLEMAPIWERKYAEHVTIGMLAEIANFPKKLNILLI